MTHESPQSRDWPRIERRQMSVKRCLSERIAVNISDAVNELRHTGSAWLEIVFGAIGVVAALWSYYLPYVSRSMEMAPTWCCALFMAFGLAQWAAFFLRGVRLRRYAARGSFAFWCGVTWVLFTGDSLGWMGATAPVIAGFEIMIDRILRRLVVNGGRRTMDCDGIKALTNNSPTNQQGKECA